MQVLELPRNRFGEASVVIADAFLDDPGWADVGPDRRNARHPYIRRVAHGVLKTAARSGGPSFYVERGGRVAGVLSSLDPGQWPPPHAYALAVQAPGPLLAGPSTFLRSLRADTDMARGHPEEQHVFVSILVAAPAYQRSGIGRALLSHTLDRADGLGVPTYLDTANPDNLPYYRSFGFEPIGQMSLPRGAPLWFMLRDVR